MDKPNYLIINPLQIKFLLSDKINNKINNKRKLSEIEEKFYNKMGELKNIILQHKRLKYMIQNINHRLI
jgi:hypothetical protein